MKDIPEAPAPQLDVRDLRLVLALSSAGSTARAASLLHLTQPAVSRALLAVEDKLEARLFERNARGLQLTAAGHTLVAGAERVLTALIDLEHRVRTPPSAPQKLRIVCECYTAYHWLPSALRQLRETLPDFDVTIAVDHTEAPVEALAAGEIDVALLTTAVVPRGPLRERPLFSDEVVFVMAVDHPLASKKTLTPADLRTSTLLTSRVPAGEAHWFASAVFGRSRPKLKVERLPLTEAILDVARAGVGVAVMSEWIAGPHLGKGDLLTKRLASGPLRRPWRLAYRSELEPAALRLLSVLEDAPPRLRAV